MTPTAYLYVRSLHIHCCICWTTWKRKKTKTWKNNVTWSHMKHIVL